MNKYQERKTKIKQEELNRILELHKKWLNNEDGGIRADLSRANLSGSNLRGADLRGADLRYANLSYANLRYANLRYANLRYANLSEANLSGSNLRGADLRGADLSGVKYNEDTSMFLPQCPEGSFIAWKKAFNGLLVKLQIPEDAKRSSATSLKCRANKALVLDIEDLDGNKFEQAISKHDSNFVYKVGEMVEVKDFDEDRWNECSSGIHFFISKEMARIY